MRSRFLRALVVCTALLGLLLNRSDSVRAQSPPIVISQVYGGGGNSGATWKNDFVELFNPGSTTVNVTGWSVQYASAGGTTWQVTALSGLILPGKYYLIQESAGAGGTQNLPAPNASGSIAMASGAGKVALVSSATALTGGCPTGGPVVDFVGYGTGTGGASCFEGTAAAPTLSNTTADLRKNNGVQDTNNNSADFTAGTPNPRNSPQATSPSGTMAADAANYNVGQAITLTVNVTPGTNPPSTGLGVSADLSSIGLGTQTFADQGDQKTFVYTGVIQNPPSGGPKSLTATITDGQTRSAATAPATSINILLPTQPALSQPLATPSNARADDVTLLTVRVTAGANPTSTILTVTGDLSAIGGAGSQAFFDDGTHGDASAHDGTYSFLATIPPDSALGSTSIPMNVVDDLARTSSTTIPLSVLAAIPRGIKISQVYGGGGNSGATFTNDFIELFNNGANDVDVSLWSVQYHSAPADTNPWFMTPLCAAGQTCVIPAGTYFLVQEAAGTTNPNAVTPLPTPDAAGAINLGSAGGRVALVSDTNPTDGGSCPSADRVVDLVGSNGAICSETSPTGALSNTLAAIRKRDGCSDTNNNLADFTTSTGPFPRNSSSTPATCVTDPTKLAGSGVADPSSLEVSNLTTLTVRANPATTPPSTGLAVTADLSAIGGSAAQAFYDDGTNGDKTAGDNVFTFRAAIGDTISTGAKSLAGTLTDAEGRSATVSIPLTVVSPTCGVERWSVKTGTDPDASHVDVEDVIHTSIADLRSRTAPATPPDNARFGPDELTVFTVNATMTLYKKETDVDYHIVLQDEHGNTMVSEIPYPGCVGAGSPFASAIAAVRKKFDARLTAAKNFQTANMAVQMTGIGFFDFIHGQTGVAPNGIELHPILDMTLTTSTPIGVASSSPSGSQFGSSITFTASVGTGTSPVPTGRVTFMDGGVALDGSVTPLDAFGHASFTTFGLPVGSHAITAFYEGDAVYSSATSGVLTQPITKADQTIDFPAPAAHTFGDTDFLPAATATSGLPVGFAIASGPAAMSGNLVHITGSGTVTITASQAGNASYNQAPDVQQSFDVRRADQTIGFAALPDKSYGDPPFTVSATFGGSGNPVTFTATGDACSSGGDRGATITILSAGFCTITASQAGNGNYNPAPDVSRLQKVLQTEADIRVTGYKGVYDGLPHGATGTATGNLGENFGSLLDLGASFTNVPGGTATWTFAGNTNYARDSGTAAIEITKATPALSNLSALTIEAGTTMTTVRGRVSLGALIPTGSVAITLNGVAQSQSVGLDGWFTATFETASLPPAAYTVSFAYGGDNNFNPIAPTATLSVVDNTAPVISGVSVTPDTLGPPNHKMIDVALAYQAIDLGADGHTVVTAAPSCGLSVTSSEPVNGTGDGNTATDWLVVDAHHVLLRDERAGTGSGRVYTIAIACTDAAGNRGSSAATVRVPK